VKVHRTEGVANHSGPESCAVAREGVGEALTGGSSRQGCESCKVKVLVPSITCIRTASMSGACGGNEARSART
jgi:hypothetical protein